MVNEVAVGRLLARPGRAAPLADAVLSFAGDRIAAVAPAAGQGRGKSLIALPALVNAHDHGRGLHHLAFGARDQAFELWRAALYAHPPIDPYLNAALAFGRLAQAGVGSVMHVHSSIDIKRLPADAEAVCRAARDVGIRLAFVVPLRDQQTLGYGSDDALLAAHPEADQPMIRSTWLNTFPSPGDYVALVREIAARVEGPLISVQYGPNSPQACSDALLAAIGEASAADGRRVTTHLLETSIQRQWADATYPDQGFLPHLDRLGLISQRFTGAHGVWLTAADIALLAERGAQIAVNTSSNLRLRSGIAPVAQYLKAGMRFSFGIDSFSVDDDDDAFRELRLGHWLHSPHHAERRLDPVGLFDGWLGNGYFAVNNEEGYGALAPDAPADLVLLDFDAMAHDVIDGMAEDMDVLLTRATTRHVRDVFVAGRQIVRDGRVLGVDLPAIEQEVLSQARATGARMRDLKPVLERSQATLSSFYQAGGHIRR